MVVIVNPSEYEHIVKLKFDLLKDFFEFDPGDMSVTILGLNDFESTYMSEYNKKSPNYVVGFAASNGRIFILKKEDLTLKNHNPQEFEKLILHELSHIFIRRIIDPKQTYVWIEEGICQYLSFGYIKLVKKIDFDKLKTPDQWEKNRAYSQTAAFFEFLIDNFGKKTLIKYLKDIKNKGEGVSFKDNFGDFKELEKKFFNKYY